MRFLKKLFSKNSNETRESIPPDVKAIITSLPKSAKEFMEQVQKLQKLRLPPKIYNRHLRYFVTSMPEWLTREIHQMIRKEIYRVNIAPTINAEATKNLVALRIALYNKDYRESPSPLLAKLFMVLFNLAPELLKNRNQLDTSDEDLTSSLDLEAIVEDLSIFNLSETQLQYTVSKILEYNEKNVLYTEEEIVLMNNSEIIRELLEQLTHTFQTFVQSISDWKRYRDPREIGLHPLALPILDIDTTELFPEYTGSSFLDIVLDGKPAKKLEKEVPKKLRPLFSRNFRLIVSAMRNTVLSEHHRLISETRKIICWNLLLMENEGELPPQPLIRSLLEKSLHFHRNYYPELIEAVLPVINRILAVIGKDGNGIFRLPELYPNEISEAMAEYVQQHFPDTISFEQFIRTASENRKQQSLHIQNAFSTGEYKPEELDYLKHNPDAELGILMMNEKLALAEKEEPLLVGHHFYPTRESFLKVVLLETLLSIVTSHTQVRIVRSLLEKSMDRTKEKSVEIMHNLLSRLKEEGMKHNVIEALLEKRLKKHHISGIIKQELARSSEWDWLLAKEDPLIHLDTFSRVTGIAFLRAKSTDNWYKITAKYEKGRWSVTRIAPDSQKHSTN